MDKITVAVFDLDDTLIHEGFKTPILMPNTMYILEISKFFDLILDYHDYTRKKSHLSKIIEYFDVKPCEIIFFDDLYENTDMVNKMGIHTVLVNHITGIGIKDIDF